ncbi:MAG: c-type cytochrome, partial [Bacteroidota bacterium]|nr:c-type cytochrome [Bacteroidota bacterium]
YEVPLDHPKRDKVRGRIWRITYKGKDNDRQDLTTASIGQLISALDHENLVIRFTAADQLVERIGKAAVTPVEALIKDEDASGREYIHGLWVLHRLNALSDELIGRSANHRDPIVRLHTMRVLLERDLAPDYFELVSKRLADSDPHVRRAATELLVKFPTMVALEKALEQRGNVPEDDTHQLYTTRLVLRNLLRDDNLMKEVASKDWKQQEAKYLVDVIVGVPSENAAVFLAKHIAQTDWEGVRLVRLYEHLSRYIPSSALEQVISSSRQRQPGDVDFQTIAFRGIQSGIARRGAQESGQIRSWGTAVATQVLEKYPAQTGGPSDDVRIKQRLAAELAGNYRMRSLEPSLLAFFQDGSNGDVEVKVAALRSLLILDANKHASLAGKILQDTVPSQFKNRVASMLGDFSGPAINEVLADVAGAPPDLQSAIVMSLAATPEGKNIIFMKVRNGELLPRTLIQPKVEERILLNISPKQKQEFEAITTKLEPVSKERQTLIDTRLIAFNTIGDEVSIDSGKMVFKENCSVCHTIGSEGGSVGPQLDGVGKWGPRALTEKILDPNRNVSEAFRNYTLRLKDGKVMSGLFRRVEGEVLVFADVSGKEFSVAKNQIVEQTPSRYTLMPDHFGEVLSQDDFNALLKYLLGLQS